MSGPAPPTARRAAAAGLVLLGVVALASTPAGRDQLRLSLTRQPARYVELWFTDPAAVRSCRPGPPPVAISLVRHGPAGLRPVRFTATLTGAGPPRIVHGSVPSAEAVPAVTALRFGGEPQRRYRLTVAVAGAGRIALSCEGDGR